MKDWPTWLRRFGVASLVLAALDIFISLLVWIPCFTKGCDMLGESVVTAFLLLPMLATLIIFWAAIFSIYHFFNNRKWFNTALATVVVIASVIIVGLLAYFSTFIFFHP